MRVFALCGFFALSGAFGTTPFGLGRQELDLSGAAWRLRGYSWSSTQPFINVTMPGDFNDALWRAGHLDIHGDIYFGTNLQSRAIKEVAYESWWLNTTLSVPLSWYSLPLHQLVFEGIDYNVSVYINQQKLGSSCGQYRRASFTVTSLLQKGESNELSILFHAPPKAFLDQWLAPGNAVQDVMYNYLDWWKSMVGIGYDFGQPIWSQGLWAPVRLIAPAAGLLLSDFAVSTQLAPPYSDATLFLSIVIYNSGSEPVSANLQWHAMCTTNQKIPSANDTQSLSTLMPGRNDVNFTLHLISPALWWPRGAGAQNLYKATVRIELDGDIVDNMTQSFGIRDLQEVENAGPSSWRYIEEFVCGPKDDPTNCTFPPADATPAEVKANRSWTFQINGRHIFAHGANWVPCDMMISRCGESDYEYLLRLAVEGNHNFLRVWGGGGIEKESFYETADKLGIMIYQEMVHSQAMPVRDANFAAEQIETEEAVKRLRTHPSVVRYGWGNEFYGVNRTSNRFERQFEEIANRFDNGRKATHGSPVTWSARHGPYCFYFTQVGPGGPFPCEPSPGYAAYNQGTMNQEGPNDPFEWDEYGAGGIASEYSLRRMIPQEHLFPLNSSQEDWIFHRAFDAVGPGTMWLGRDAYLPLFGEPADLIHEIYASQFAQAEGLRYANQAHRRAMPHRSMSAYWTFNEAWPNAAYGSVVEFAGPVKMAYYMGAKRPYAETDVSLRYDQIAYPSGSRLPASVWCVSEAEFAFPARVDATMLTLNGTTLGRRSWTTRVGGLQDVSGTSEQLGDLGLYLPPTTVATVVLVRLRLLRLESADVVSDQVYTFAVLPAGHDVSDRRVTPLLGALWESPPAAITMAIKKIGDGQYLVVMRNAGTAPALYVELKPISSGMPENEQFHPAVFSDNFMVLFAGEKVSVKVELLSAKQASATNPDELCASGWNIPRICSPLPTLSDSHDELFI